MGTEPRYCINCKHHLEGLSLNCRRDVEIRYERSVVDGKTRKFVSGGDSAKVERRYEEPQYCGPSAKFYVENRLTRRLIAMFKD